ncbi:hypothetical protein GCM10011376_20920 [Nocardioides flavus (ex Wang et al. 2016)]|uniref:GH26 domain-containing protein n=1 Tax=Nocardioides flavus (ex Wang et al. 2016) TaxID=2058780 RepID=A0ABQ3HLD8_9ACTN|nr:glycosyl hydrolase [Nocardioides flavus (ex Wang et al. 2016)]GHE17482.1 hypothetical protein GCM10011376_20920 [Nocardioides flavus (ex Wang et al. 2016)]
MLHPRPRRARVALVGVLVGALASVLAPATDVASASGSASTGRPVVDPAQGSRRSVGLVVAGAPSDLSEARAIERRTGVDLDALTFYVAWSRRGDFPARHVSRITSAGAVPVLTWEPWDPARGVRQPAYALDTIARGDHDAYLRRWARQVRAWGKPLVIRFAHEMNGDWYPWAEGVNGNRAGDHAAAWRHVVRVFRRAGARNVRWSWSVNVPYPGSTPIASLYPGDAFVDRVGLDGYNWGTTQPWSTWQSFGDLVGPGVAELRAISSRPVNVDETAAPARGGGDKAAWIAGMWDWLAAHREVRGVTWFSLRKEVDWRVDSSRRTLAVWARGARRF